MLQVTFYRDRQGRFSAFAARGHTDFAEHGEDVVCAAVSAILQAAALGLAEYAKAELTSQQRSGSLEIVWREDQRDWESVRAIVATAELAVEQIAERFPKHVRLKRVKKPAHLRRTDDV
ncbi:MAG TPA: ribosomal-processing cysteine protease Prp [Candidatus Acidoferrales bacterium]|jgi:uncharacterized protein YsxB (DUF464 family)|nr:ribosomal-processing cysteine protease Prp [Candidatus Acidoferrales bacterium]